MRFGQLTCIVSDFALSEMLSLVFFKLALFVVGSVFVYFGPVAVKLVNTNVLFCKDNQNPTMFTAFWTRRQAEWPAVTGTGCKAVLLYDNHQYKNLTVPPNVLEL